MDSLLDIAQVIKYAEPLRAGLMTMCWESGSCKIEIAVTHNVGAPGRSLISHDGWAFLILAPGAPDMLASIGQWLDEQHSPFEAF